MELLLRRLWARREVPVTQASGRSGLGLLGQPAYECALHAGRPDSFNVWHAVPGGKTLRAKNFSQMQSNGHI